MAISMQHDMTAKDETAVETTGRLTWNTPRYVAVPVEARTEGAFIPGPAEIPSLCS